jgi:hypothetical protein
MARPDTTSRVIRDQRVKVEKERAAASAPVKTKPGPILVSADDELTPSEAAEFEDLDRIVHELGGAGAYVMVYRKDEKSGRLKYKCKMPADSFTVEDLRQDYGGGLYQVRLFDSTGHYIKAYSHDIDGQPTAEGMRIAGQGTAPAPMAGLEPFALMMQMMISQNQMLGNLLAAAITGKGSGGDSPSDIMKTAKELAEYATGRGTAADPMAMMERMMGVFNRGIEMGKSLEGGGGGPFDSVISSFAPIFGELLLRGGAPAAPGRVPVQLPPQNRTLPVVQPPKPAIEGQPPMAITSGPAWLKDVERYLPTFVQLADLNLPPERAVDIILDGLPQATAAALEEEAKKDEFVDVSFNALPEALKGPRAEWAQKVLLALKLEVLAPTEDEVTS